VAAVFLADYCNTVSQKEENMNKRFPVLSTVSNLLRVVGWLVVIAATLLLVGCGEKSTLSLQPRNDDPTLEMMYQEIYDVVQDLTCEDSSVCASIALGSKPCGGPRTYLVYSTTTVNEEELVAKVFDLYTYEAEYNAQEHILSDCSVASPAVAGCVNHECVDLNWVP